MKEHPFKTYRIANGITQTQLAQTLGVSYATVNHIENGRRRVTPENAQAWEKKIPLSRKELCPSVFSDDLSHKAA